MGTMLAYLGRQLCFPQPVSSVPFGGWPVRRESPKCAGIGPYIAKALARAIRPEVDGGASLLALLPTQGAAYASRHV